MAHILYFALVIVAAGVPMAIVSVVVLLGGVSAEQAGLIALLTYGQTLGTFVAVILALSGWWFLEDPLERRKR